MQKLKELCKSLYEKVYRLISPLSEETRLIIVVCVLAVIALLFLFVPNKCTSHPSASNNNPQEVTTPTYNFESPSSAAEELWNIIDNDLNVLRSDEDENVVFQDYATKYGVSLFEMKQWYLEMMDRVFNNNNSKATVLPEELYGDWVRTDEGYEGMTISIKDIYSVPLGSLSKVTDKAKKQDYLYNGMVKWSRFHKNSDTSFSFEDNNVLGGTTIYYGFLDPETKTLRVESIDSSDTQHYQKIS